MAATLKCLTCGAELKFNATSQNWRCEYCEAEFTEDDLKEFTDESLESLDETIEVQSVNSQTEEGMVEYKCSYCGASVITLPETSATFCVYCQRPIALENQLSGQFKPSAVVPFKNTKEIALEQFKKFLKGKRFLPNAYVAEQNIEKLTGVYVPFWLYSGEVDFDIQGDAEQVKSVTRGDYMEVTTSYFTIERKGTIALQHVPVDASKKIDDNIMDSIEPFDLSELKKFGTPYLSGFLAERYDVPKDEAFERAKTRFEGTADRVVDNSLAKYNTVKKKVNNKKLRDTKAIYALLPVWLLYSTFMDNTYEFAMNGQTSKILGNLPIDKSKVVKFAGLLFATSSVVFNILGYLIYNVF